LVGEAQGPQRVADVVVPEEGIQPVPVVEEGLIPAVGEPAIGGGVVIEEVSLVRDLGGGVTPIVAATEVPTERVGGEPVVVEQVGEVVPLVGEAQGPQRVADVVVPEKGIQPVPEVGERVSPVVEVTVRGEVGVVEEVSVPRDLGGGVTPIVAAGGGFPERVGGEPVVVEQVGDVVPLVAEGAPRVADVVVPQGQDRVLPVVGTREEPEIAGVALQSLTGGALPLRVEEPTGQAVQGEGTPLSLSDDSGRGLPISVTQREEVTGLEPRGAALQERGDEVALPTSEDLEGLFVEGGESDGLRLEATAGTVGAEVIEEPEKLLAVGATLGDLTLKESGMELQEVTFEDEGVDEIAVSSEPELLETQVTEMDYEYDEESAVTEQTALSVSDLGEPTAEEPITLASALVGTGIDSKLTGREVVRQSEVPFGEDAVVITPEAAALIKETLLGLGITPEAIDMVLATLSRGEGVEGIAGDNVVSQALKQLFASGDVMQAFGEGAPLRVEDAVGGKRIIRRPVLTPKATPPQWLVNVLQDRSKPVVEGLGKLFSNKEAQLVLQGQRSDPQGNVMQSTIALQNNKGQPITVAQVSHLSTISPERVQTSVRIIKLSSTSHGRNMSQQAQRVLANSLGADYSDAAQAAAGATYDPDGDGGAGGFGGPGDGDPDGPGGFIDMTPGEVSAKLLIPEKGIIGTHPSYRARGWFGPMPGESGSIESQTINVFNEDGTVAESHTETSYSGYFWSWATMGVEYKETVLTSDSYYEYDEETGLIESITTYTHEVGFGIDEFGDRVAVDQSTTSHYSVTKR
ncbi:hypothetical protein ACFL1T_05100, partial [Chlamydiota bacterium]